MGAFRKAFDLYKLPFVKKVFVLSILVALLHRFYSTQLFSVARGGFNFSHNPYLSPCIVGVSSKSSGETAKMCRPI